MEERLRSISIGTFLSLAILSEAISYYTSSFVSRILLFIAFFLLISLLLICTRSNHNEQNAFNRKTIAFVMLLAVSFCFLLRRYYSMSPTFLEVVAHSQTFTRAQSYGEAGFLVFNSPNSFIFQHSLVAHFLSSICGIPMGGVVYVSLFLHAILVALVGLLVLGIVRDAFKKCEGTWSNLVAPLVAFSLVSFAYSERIEIALPVALLLMFYLLSAGLTDRSKEITVLFLVLGVTFGSATSIFVIVPFFFLFSLFRRRSTTIVYGLIPLSYLIYSGYSYTVALKHYFVFAWEGFSEFLRGILSGQMPERVLPWHRSTVPTVEDTYVASATYLSLILLSGVLLIIALSAWVKNRSHKRNDENALFLANSVTLFFTLGVASFIYVGASVQPEATFADIRTIVIVFITLLVPFLFASRRLLERIDGNKVLLALLAVLMIVASLRTYYEVYPKSICDPINAVEDLRVDPLSVYHAGDFLKSHWVEGSIAFDFKTGSRISPDLPSEILFQSNIFTSMVVSSEIVVFDLNGLIFGSLHTSPEAYVEAYNLTLTQNVIYNSGNITIIQRK